MYEKQTKKKKKKTSFATLWWWHRWWFSIWLTMKRMKLIFAFCSFCHMTWAACMTRCSLGHTKKQKKSQSTTYCKTFVCWSICRFFVHALLSWYQLSILYYILPNDRSILVHTHTKHEEGFCSLEFTVLQLWYSTATDAYLVTVGWNTHASRMLSNDNPAYSIILRTGRRRRFFVEWFLTFRNVTYCDDLTVVIA